MISVVLPALKYRGVVLAKTWISAFAHVLFSTDQNRRSRYSVCVTESQLQETLLLYK